MTAQLLLSISIVVTTQSPVGHFTIAEQSKIAASERSLRADRLEDARREVLDALQLSISRGGTDNRWGYRLLGEILLEQGHLDQAAFVLGQGWHPTNGDHRDTAVDCSVSVAYALSRTGGDVGFEMAVCHFIFNKPYLEARLGDASLVAPAEFNRRHETMIALLRASSPLRPSTHTHLELDQALDEGAPAAVVSFVRAQIYERDGDLALAEAHYKLAEKGSEKLREIAAKRLARIRDK